MEPRGTVSTRPPLTGSSDAGGPSERPPAGSIGTMTDPDTLRVGDREREQAVAVLHEAVGGGYLDLSEFEERSRTVYAARTRGDLREALADLPGAVPLFRPDPAAPAGGTLPVPATVPGERLDIDWTSVKRRGAWSVPPSLVISGSMGTADLDLRSADVPPGGCVVEIATSWSTIKLRLAPATLVRTTHLRLGSMSTFKDRAGPPTGPGGAVIDLRGSGNWTSVVLRRD